MKRMDFVLSDEEIIRITRILADDDAQGALDFFSHHLSRSGKDKPANRCDIVIEGEAADDLAAMIKADDTVSCLEFLRDHFEKEIKLILTPHCVPVF